MLLPDGVLSPFIMRIAMFSLRSFLTIVLVPASGAIATYTIRTEANITNIITRDVVIVGGGASGAHAAVRLSDMGKTVVVVEKQGQLVSCRREPSAKVPRN